MTFPHLLEQSYRTTGGVLAAVPPERLDVPSPCEGWTARQVANHLVGSLSIFGRVVAGVPVPEEDYADSDRDLLGADPAQAFEAVAQQAVSAFSQPGALDRSYPFVFGETPGIVIANISLSESLVHGWDIATSTGATYDPDDAIVAAVQEFQSQGTEEMRTSSGMYAASRPVADDAPPIGRLVAFLGRKP